MVCLDLPVRVYGSSMMRFTLTNVGRDVRGMMNGYDVIKIDIGD